MRQAPAAMQFWVIKSRIAAATNAGCSRAMPCFACYRARLNRVFDVGSDDLYQPEAGAPATQTR